MMGGSAMIGKSSRVILLVTTLHILCGCASNIKVHLYTEYLSSHETRDISLMLQSYGYSISLSETPIPRGLKYSTLIYSPLTKNAKEVEELADIIEREGYGYPELALTGRENHHYSRSNVGWYLIPEGFEPKTIEATHSQLALEYTGLCSSWDADLNLKKDGTFSLTAFEVSENLATGITSKFQGSWTSTHKSVELVLENGSFATFSVFRFSEPNKVGGQEGYRLIRRPETPFFDNCDFIYGHGPRAEFFREQ